MHRLTGARVRQDPMRDAISALCQSCGAQVLTWGLQLPGLALRLEIYDFGAGRHAGLGALLRRRQRTGGGGYLHGFG